MTRVEGITKSYGNNRGIYNLCMECGEGEVVSFIGPNGSGKTTSLKGIAGLLKLESGYVLLDGKNTLDSNTKKEIGYLPQRLNFSPNMTGYELIETINVLKYQRNQGACEDELKQMFSDFDLWESRHMKLRNYSVGMRKKIGIMIAMMHFPKLIILDEPTNAVDTKGIITLKEYIEEAKKRGCIVIVSSHILDFISSISTKNIFIKNGKVARIVERESHVNLEEVYKELYL